jgi:hypothetical protein
MRHHKHPLFNLILHIVIPLYRFLNTLRCTSVPRCMILVYEKIMHCAFKSHFSLWLILLVEETGVSGENHQPATLSHNVVSSTP